MRPYFTAFVMMAMLAGPAYSQQGGEVNSANKDPYKLKLEREQNERDEIERAYDAQMKRLKAQNATPTSSDPWKTIRPVDNAAKR